MNGEINERKLLYRGTSLEESLVINNDYDRAKGIKDNLGIY